MKQKIIQEIVWIKKLIFKEEIMGLFESVQNKIIQLNRGILNPNNAPSHLGASECMELGHLSMLLDAGINDFNNSNKSDLEILKLSELVNKTEKKANSILKWLTVVS